MFVLSSLTRRITTSLKPTPFLRIAAGLTLLQAIFQASEPFGSPKHGVEEVAVLVTMKSHFFDAYGSMRSYWDFLLGYTLLLSVVLVAQAILFWQLGSFAKTNPIWTKPIVGLFFVTSVVTATVSGRYLFFGPMAAHFVIATCLAIAFGTA